MSQFTFITLFLLVRVLYHGLYSVRDVIRHCDTPTTWITGYLYVSHAHRNVFMLSLISMYLNPPLTTPHDALFSY